MDTSEDRHVPTSATRPTQNAHTPPPKHTPPPAKIPREIWVLIVAAFVIAIGYGLVAPVLPQYAKSFDVGVAAASVIVSAFAFMRLVFAPAGGALIARIGERSVYLTGLLIVAVSTGASALAQGYWQLLVFRGLGGIGSTMFTVSAMGLIVRLAPPTIRGRVSSAYGTAFLVGNVAGPLLGSLLSGLGYRAPFVIYAIALLVAAGVVVGALSSASLRPAPGVVPLQPLGVRQGLRSVAYRSALVASFANGWTNFGVRVAIIPLFAATTPSLGPVMAGVSLTVFALGNFLVLQPSGLAVDKYGRKPLIVAGLLLSAAGMLAMPAFPTSLPAFLGLSLATGMGAGMLSPGLQASVADIIGSGRNGGKVLAAFQMSSDFGAIFGPIIAGAVADRVGFGWAFALSGAILLCGALAWLPAHDTLREVRIAAKVGL